MSEEQAVVVHKSPLSEEDLQRAVLTGKFLWMTPEQRDYVILWMHLKNGYDPLSKAFIFIPGSQKDPEPKLYATASAAKQEKEKKKLSVAWVYGGPLATMLWVDGKLTIGAVCEPRLYVGVWVARDKDGVETWDGSAMALAPEVSGLVNDFKKFITQAQNRTIFRASGSAFMDSTEASDFDKGFGPPPSQPAQPQATRKPAPPRAEAQIPVEQAIPIEARRVETPMGPATVTGAGLMEGVALEPQPPAGLTPSSTIHVVKNGAQEAPVAKPVPVQGLQPRPVGQAGGASASPPPGPRPLPRSPLPAAKPPDLGGKK